MFSKITGQNAWNKHFDGYKIQFCRSADFENKIVEWKDCDMFAFNQSELDHRSPFIFRLKPLMINGFEVEPPLSQKERENREAKKQLVYSLDVGASTHYWDDPEKRNIARKALQSFFIV